MDIWLPPSEGKNAPSDGPNLNLDSLSFPILNSTRAEIIKACAQITETHTAQRVFNIGAKHEAELAANRALMSQPCAPASTVFTGVLYEALREHNPTIWEGPEARHILIFSGIFGVLRADDMIPLHRLAMGATLPPLGKVSALWRRVLNEELKDPMLSTRSLTAALVTTRMHARLSGHICGMSALSARKTGNEASSRTMRRSGAESSLPRWHLPPPPSLRK